MIDPLTTELQAQAEALTTRVLDDMYTDPFWDARYGERGRKFAHEDGLHHITYVVQALSANDDAVFTKYARWLRSVLVSRGMCTSHIVDNFERLQRAIAEIVPNSEPARAVLSSGVDALQYRQGPAAELHAAAARISDAVAPAADSGSAWRRNEALKLLSYLADGLESGRSDRFTEHARWLSRYAERRGLAADYFTKLLSDLIAQIEADASSSQTLRTGTRALFHATTARPAP
jgi:hypothetical protein